MSSSLINPVQTQPSGRTGLLELLAAVPDPRDRRGVRHTVSVILAVSVAAVLAGARSFAAIGEWVADQDEHSLGALGARGQARPSESTIRRLLARLDGDVLDSKIAAWMWTATSVVDGRRVIAMDGKTVRGARTKDREAPHLVAALEHQGGLVLGQIAIAAKSNEIPAVRDLLAGFDPAELHGCVITLDAMHTQTDTAKTILTAGADYVLTVKANQPKLLARLKALPWKDVPAHTATTTGHGRRATRTIKVADAPAWTGFAGAAQVAQLRRTVTKKGKKSVEVVYLITSAPGEQAPPAVLASWVQNHWSIENRLHWVRDVTFDEDRSQVRTGAAPQVMATIRNTVVSLLRLAGWTNIAAALRHHARKPERSLNLLMTC